ncbi:hypothetical protein [Fusobacterium vincentii ATCC 49256]|uniref:Uncharacterized protein n=1 Tax=Fusobacterium vincentii ATCC 49256 TaxID=209882 RepID=Q7P6C1_FUSVC|nr:hypothetical protein [Fusobacterium vincentii ATCC 49256]
MFEQSEFKFFSERVVFKLKNSVSVRDSFFKLSRCASKTIFKKLDLGCKSPFLFVKYYIKFFYNNFS